MRGLATAIVLGAALDAVAGDPERGHPVAGFGRAGIALERALWRPRRGRGALYAAVLVGGAAAAARAADRTAAAAGLRLPLQALCVWTVLGGRSLGREALLLADALDRGALDEARRRAPALVGRDPSELDTAGLARAAVESVAENTGDAVVAPLLWAALAGVPGAVAYRAANTLDAMVGRRSERYLEFGWASARLDDVAGWPAARLGAALAALLAPVAGGNTLAAARVLRRDGRRHPSPNAGLLEAAFAGALGVRLGGRNVYAGRVEERPFLGDGRAPDPGDVRRAVRLSRAISLAAVALCSMLARGLRR
jgi:adenosylcobinamide-phosphate synthase